MLGMQRSCFIIHSPEEIEKLFPSLSLGNSYIGCSAVIKTETLVESLFRIPTMSLESSAVWIHACSCCQRQSDIRRGHTCFHSISVMQH